MPRYKRSAQEAELDLAILDEKHYTPEQDETLSKLRNMWEFASFMQYVYIFGSAVKISEDFDIEDLEQECLQSQSSQLADMGLTLLKYVSSHRGLTHDIFAEYTRRQYLAKAPERNPFGDEDDPIPFNDLDIFTRIRVLQQLSTWTFTNPDRMRSLMPEDDDHLDWRIEPLGWDADDRSYFVLDDNRLYRRTDDEPPPPSPPKAKQKAKGKKKAAPRGTRTSKRRKVDESEDEGEDQDEVQDVVMTDSFADGGFGFTDKTWECIAITLDEYQDFLATIRKSRDPNEKALRNRIESDVLPVIERRAEALKAKEMKKLRELENLQKMATAKRSSRIADKADRAAKEQEERDAEEKRISDLRMARHEQDRQRRIEEGHESRRLTREQRLKEREVKRILHEEELARIEREASTAASQPDDQPNGVRLSSRNLQTQREAHQRELELLQQSLQEDKWYFDCVICGMHGENLDDGSHSVACERCNVWQHSKCHGFTPEQCEDEDFHFVCRSCRKKDKAEQAERSGITLKLGKRPTESPKTAQSSPAVKQEAVLPDYVQRQLVNMDAQQYRPEAHQLQNGHVLPRPQQQQPPQMYYHSAAIQSHAQQAPSYSHIQQIPVPPTPVQPTPIQPTPVQQPPGQQPPGQQRSVQHTPAQQPPFHHPPFQHYTQQLPAQRSPSRNHAEQHRSKPQNGAQQQRTPSQNHIHQPQPQSQSYAPQQQLTPSQNHTHQSQAQSYGQQLTPSQNHGHQLQPQSYSQQLSPTLNHSHQSQPQSYGQQLTPSQNHTHQLLSQSYGQQQPSFQNHAQQHQAIHSQAVNGIHQHIQSSPAVHGAPRSLQAYPGQPRQLSSPSNTQSPAQPSPQTTLPPPPQRQAAISPEKSSPPRAAPAINGQQETPRLNTDKQTILATPTASFDNAPRLTTPIKNAASPVPAERTGDSLAATGMRGPWPDGSMHVPQKHEAPTQP